MSKHHSSVAYVEPNDIHTFDKGVIADGGFYDRMPNPEDYCISLDIEVELSSRDDALRKNDKENNVIIMSYKSGKNGDTVNFMSGSKIDIAGYPNVLSTRYADMFITDLVDYGTTEMLGIKSVDIEYNSACVPIITIRFTDVRGMSLFQPEELNKDHSYNGIRGYSKGNIAQSFFRSFFALPLPKYTIRLKGFYGRPVSYQVMCDKFDAKFNSDTGDFDVTARFIGFAYSFMSDVSFDALLAAPYSDYFGENYWMTNVNNGRFTLPDKTGQSSTPMPRLYDVRKYFKTLVNDADKDYQDTPISDEELTHKEEIASLSKIRDMYRKWYSDLYNLLVKKYGKDFVHIYERENAAKEKDYWRIIILTNGKNIPGDNLGGVYAEFTDDAFKQINGDLYNTIEEYNSSSMSFKKLDNVSKDFTKYTKSRTFNELWYNDRKKEIVFEGFHKDNILPKTETVNRLFTEGYEQTLLRRMYDDGVNQYLYTFVIDEDYSSINQRIKSLIEDGNRTEDAKKREKKVKEINRHMFEKMGWYPTIENFSKIVMAHLETLMAMMFDVIDKTKDRTPSDLQVTIGADGNCNDVDANSVYIPPFPRITKLVTGDDGISKREDAWAGDFTGGKGFAEVDMVNGLLNAVSVLNQIENQISESVNQINAGETDVSSRKCIVKYPLTSYDFYLNSNPYGSSSEVGESIYTVAGKVCMRMFGILSLSYFRNLDNNAWLNIIDNIAKVEAENFYDLIRLTNVDIRMAFGEGGQLSNGNKIIEIITGKVPENIPLPWQGNDGKSRALFSESGQYLDLIRYTASQNPDVYVRPLQELSFKDMDDVISYFNKNQIPIENNNICVNRLVDYGEAFSKMLRNDITNCFNALYIDKNYRMPSEMVNEAASMSSDDYKPIYDAISGCTELDSIKFKTLFAGWSGFLSSFNTKVQVTNRVTVGNNVPRTITGEKVVPNMTFDNMGGDENFDEYRYDENSIASYFDSDIANGNVETCLITESFGFKLENGIYKPDKNKSLMLLDSYYQLPNWNAHGLTIDSSVVKSAFFVMGIDCFDYGKCGAYLHNRSLSYIPNVLALQIGAVMIAHAAANSATGGIAAFMNEKAIQEISKILPVQGTMKSGGFYTFINHLSPLSRIAYAKHFFNWANENYSEIFKMLGVKKVEVKDKPGKYHIIPYGPNQYTAFYKGEGIYRALFNQDSAYIKSLTNDLMLPVIVARGTTYSNVNMSKNNQGEYFSILNRISKGDASKYLDSFIERLRTLYNIGAQQENTGNVTTIAKDPSQSTKDMKIELYRYLKQVFDKWVPTTKLSDWKYETFFNGEQNNTDSLGHQFHFIDSYYNKIGDKLLINPMKVANKIGLSMSYSDVNVMMFNFLAETFAEHRCMMKCVQNFRDLANGMEDLFQLIPYEKMKRPDSFPDFVVVYTYAPSKNLNVVNGEYNDDGFMLNDEFDTPLAIRTRTDETKFYRIPAFGVSYGRQYQSYFKNVDVNMSNPIMTQQAITAKFSILAASKDKTAKISSSQDLYDIYSNQSYTCNVSMMGCAWIQPLMYFVLLNVPMFRGSYMIMKVTHRIKPGDMTTEISGCRMANTSNRLVEDIFTDETDDSVINANDLEGGGQYESSDIGNDCGYKVYPISENITVGKELTRMTDAQKAKGVAIMKKLIAKGANPSFAAGVAGNMFHETSGTFSPDSLYPNDDHYFSGGLCQWRAGNLLSLLNEEPARFGRIKEEESGLGEFCGKNSEVKNRLNKIGEDGQIKFLIDTLTEPARKKNWVLNGYNLERFNKEVNNPEEAAKLFRKIYEISSKLDPERWQAANSIFNAYQKENGAQSFGNNEQSTKEKNFKELFFKAIQKTAQSSTATAALFDVEYPSEDSIMITQKNGEKGKLAGVFDIILNSIEYYQHARMIYWLYRSSPNQEPSGIAVIVSESTKFSDRKVFMQQVKVPDTQNKKFTKDDIDNKTVCEKFIKSLGKKYNGNKDILMKECPQFSDADVAEAIVGYKPQSCSGIYCGNRDSVSVPATIASGAKIKIDGWDVGKSIEWINKYSRDDWPTKPCKDGSPRKLRNPSSCDGLCATYVEKAIKEGGGPAMKCGGSTGAATNLRYRGILKQNGFDMIESGDALPKRGNSKITPQAGDICIIGYDYETTNRGKYHACMWNGTQWVSDFKQGSMNVYNSKKYDLYPYAIFRYHNGTKPVSYG